MISFLQTPLILQKREGIEQYKKLECLIKGATSKWNLLGGTKQWTHKRVQKFNGETTNKVYAEYKQRELNENKKKMEKS